jgi:hypothetical protein
VLEIEVFVILKNTKKPTLSYFVICTYEKMQNGSNFLQNSFNWKARFLVLKKREILHLIEEVRDICHKSVRNYVK